MYIGKGYILHENLVWENVVYTTTFLAKVFCSAGFLSIEIWIGLINVALLPKIFGSRLDILTSALIAMDYFSRCQKSIFNLENNKRICEGNSIIYTAELFSEPCISQ